MINSRTVLVTAIYHCLLMSKTVIDTPSTEAKGLICRVPLTNVSLARLSLLSQSISVDSQYGVAFPHDGLLFMDSRNLLLSLVKFTDFVS